MKWRKLPCKYNIPCNYNMAGATSLYYLWGIDEYDEDTEQTEDVENKEYE